MVVRHKLSDIPVVVAEIGHAAFAVRFDYTQVQLAGGERNIHHVDTVLDDHGRRPRRHIGLERPFRREVKLARFDGYSIELVPLPPEVEVKVVAHVGFFPAGPCNDILLGLIASSHYICFRFWTTNIKLFIRFVHYLVHAGNRHGVDRFPINVVQQHDAVAGKAEAFGQGDVHTGRNVLSTHYDIHSLPGIQRDVSCRVFQLSAFHQVRLVGDCKRQRQLVVPPQRAPAMLETDLVVIGQSCDQLSRTGTDGYVLRFRDGKRDKYCQ